MKDILQEEIENTLIEYMNSGEATRVAENILKKIEVRFKAEMIVKISQMTEEALNNMGYFKKEDGKILSRNGKIL